jgi:hypothetical protein
MGVPHHSHVPLFYLEGQMKTKTQKIPSSALMLIGEEAPKVSFLKGDGDTKKARLDMVAYSGGIIKDHFWWDDLAIDLEGMKFTEKRYPILENHDTDQKIAFTGKPLTDQGNVRVDPDKTEFVSTEESEKFQRLSAEGFPYQASVRVRPKVIERVAEDASVEVNGYTLKGPGTVFRQCEFVEASVCVFGYDSKTSSKAFDKAGGVQEEITFTERLIEAPKEGEKPMDVETLKKEHPDLFQQIQDEARAAFQAEHDKEKTALSAQIESLETTVTEQGKKILASEKAETLRLERERAAAADRIWDAQLSASKVPAHLHPKVKKHVAYTGFMKEGSFDAAAFTEAVGAEIKEWETAGVSNEVIGASFLDKEAADAAATLAKEQEKEEDELVNSLLSFTNHETA